jgi:hypothetical protein
VAAGHFLRQRRHLVHATERLPATPLQHWFFRNIVRHPERFRDLRYRLDRETIFRASTIHFWGEAVVMSIAALCSRTPALYGGAVGMAALAVVAEMWRLRSHVI